MAAMSSSNSSSSTTNVVFELGKYKATLQRVEIADTKCTSSTKSSIPCSPPKPLLIGRPCEAGEFPILLLLHGCGLSNSFYSQLIEHIASHGFIAIAPQLHEIHTIILGGKDSTEDVKSTAAITNWLPEGLQSLLPHHVKADLSKLALAGHSRGGKVSFALALGKEECRTSLKFSALIGIDPVDGMKKGEQTPPPVLTYVPSSFDLDMAVMVIGSGLGEKSNFVVPPCAPKGLNHEDFFNECRKPTCYFVAKDYGHFDMLDDETKGIVDGATYWLCKNGKSREPMRKFVGGVVVAFLKAYLEGDNSHLMAIREGAENLPIELQNVDFLL